MSTALAVPMPRSKPSLGLKWVTAHVAAQAICLAAAGAAYGIATLTGANDPAAGAALKQVAFGLAIAAELVFVLSFALLRGAVLRDLLPAFPMRLWVVVVGGYMLAMYLMGSLSGVAHRAPPAAEFSSAFLLRGVLLTLILGTIFGAIIGTMEALVIRRAAEGALVWALCMAVAYGIDLAAAFAISAATLPFGELSVAASAAIRVAMKIGAGIVLALVTLPALKALRPRHQAAL